MFVSTEPFLLEDPPSHFFLPENPEEPEFAEWAETNVTAQLGGSVFLHCPVINSGDRAVSYPSVRITFDTTNTHYFFILTYLSCVVSHLRLICRLINF